MLTKQSSKIPSVTKNVVLMSETNTSNDGMGK